MSNSYGDAMFPADVELVSRSRDGDDEAFGMLVERHQDRAYRIAYGVVRNHDDALEVVQDAFVRAYRSLARFRGDAKFSTWLHRIVMNLSRNRLRSRRRRREEWTISLDIDPSDDVPYAVPEAVDPGDDPARTAEARDFEARVMGAVDRLAGDHREILWLRNVEELSYAEIAVMLGCEVGTVKSRVFRAREALRTILVNDGHL